MKHTMKKLLCMALAIMLLVSAVPVFAMAEGTTANYELTVNSTTTTGTINVGAGGMTGREILTSLNPNYLIDYDFVAFYINGNVKDGADDKVYGGQTARLELKDKAAPAPVAVAVYLTLKGESRTITTTEGADLTLTDSLVRSKNFNMPENSYVKHFVRSDTNDVVLPGTTIKAQNGLSYEVVLATNTSSENNGGTGVDNSNNGGSNNGVTTYNVKFYDVNGSCHWNIDVASGSTVGVADNTTDTQISYAEEHVGTKSGYTFSGWKKNGTGDVLSTATVADLAITANTEFRPVFTANSSSSGSGSSGTTTNKFPYPVYLNIYKDTLVGSPDKRVEITNGIALDGLVSLAEVKTVVKNYYTAKDSDGISYDGLYIAEGNWVANYVADTQKYDSIKAGEMRQTGTVYINVMIGNAKAKSTSTADTSNPKTGDTIFVPFMVMGVTATALAAAYVFGKKRIAR